MKVNGDLIFVNFCAEQKIVSQRFKNNMKMSKC